MPSGARGGMFHLGYKLAITAHEVGVRGPDLVLVLGRARARGNLGDRSRIGENSCSVVDLVERHVGEADKC